MLKWKTLTHQPNRDISGLFTYLMQNTIIHNTNQKKMKKQNAIRQMMIEHLTNKLKLSAMEVLFDKYGEKIYQLEKKYLEHLLITSAIETITIFGNELKGIKLIKNEVIQHLQNQLILNQCTLQNN